MTPLTTTYNNKSEYNVLFSKQIENILEEIVEET